MRSHIGHPNCLQSPSRRFARRNIPYAAIAVPSHCSSQHPMCSHTRIARRANSIRSHIGHSCKASTPQQTLFVTLAAAWPTATDDSLSSARLRLRAPHVDASVDASSPADISCSDNLCRHLSSSLGCGRQHLRLLGNFLRAFVCAHFLQHAQSATSLCWNVLTTCVLTLGCRLDVLL